MVKRRKTVNFMFYWEINKKTLKTFLRLQYIHLCVCVCVCVQVTLLKAGTFEMMLVHLACLFDSKNNTMLFVNGSIFQRTANTLVRHSALSTLLLRPRGGVKSIVMSMSVCLLAYLENYMTTLHKILCPSSLWLWHRIASRCCYILLVLSMTLRFFHNGL